MHENYQRQDEVVGSTNRGFGIAFAIFFSFASGVKLYSGAYHWAIAFFVASAAMAATAFIAPFLLAPFNRLWTNFGAFLHKMLNPVIFGVIFFLVFTPVGATMRLFGWDALTRKYDPEADSYWIEREPPGPQPESLNQQF